MVGTGFDELGTGIGVFELDGVFDPLVFFGFMRFFTPLCGGRAGKDANA